MSVVHHAHRRWMTATTVFLLFVPTVTSATQLKAIELGGSPGEVVDFVYVAEGYTTAEAAKFFADAKDIHETVVTSAPFSHVRQLITARALFVASVDSGSDHPALNETRDTAFDSTFDSNGIARLLTADSVAVQMAVNDAFPAFDVAILVVNDPQYGGSGGLIPMVSVHPAASAILRHELGHSLAGLADEYSSPYPGYPPGDPEPNVASTAHLSPPPWHLWLDPTTPIPTPLAAATGPHTPVGAYEGARYLKTGIFRPSPTCLMRAHNASFCPVCMEALVLAIATESSMIRGQSPLSAEVGCKRGACLTFSVTTAGLTSETITWTLDGAVVGAGEAWTPSATLVGQHTVGVVVRDASPLVRADPTSIQREGRVWSLRVQDVPPPATTADAAATADAATTASDSVDGLGAAPSRNLGRPTGGCGATRATVRTPANRAWWMSLFATWVWCLLRRRRGRHGASDDRQRTRGSAR